MSQEIVQAKAQDVAQISDIERVLIGGDLAKLNPEQRVRYYADLCHAIGLNPLLKPFDYLILNGKLVLYANKSCTEQLRALKNISVTIVAREVVDGGVYAVTARAVTASGRMDEAIGAVSLPEKGEMKANAMMKAETKSKRRVTLSICGLAMLDETETDSVPGAFRVVVDEDGRILGQDGGSREAQQAVAQRRIAETKPPAVSAETINEMNEILEQPPQQPEVIEQPKRKKGGMSFTALGEAKKIRNELKQLTGNDEAYYFTLRTVADVSHADEIPNKETWVKVFRKLNEAAKIARDKQSLEEIEKTIGTKAFMDCLGNNGVTNIDEALSLTGEQFTQLLKDLHQYVKKEVPF